LKTGAKKRRFWVNIGDFPFHFFVKQPGFLGQKSGCCELTSSPFVPLPNASIGKDILKVEIPPVPGEQNTGTTLRQ
jgi:hypothetical protein